MNRIAVYVLALFFFNNSPYAAEQVNSFVEFDLIEQIDSHDLFNNTRKKKNNTQFVGGVTQQEYEMAMEEFLIGFNATDIPSYHRVTFSVYNRWSSNIKNAGWSKSSSQWSVSVHGGLARMKNMTKDGLIAVMCHEMGHIIAGFPFYEQTNKQNYWSKEGNSDYYATLSCLNVLWENQHQINKTYRNKIAATPKKMCDDVWVADDKQNVCYRKLIAANSLAMVLYDLYTEIGTGAESVPSFSNTNSTIVTSSLDGWALGRDKSIAQCRLDTLIAGAMCKNGNSFNHRYPPTSYNTMITQSCEDGSYYGDKLAGIRPRCWFKPN